MARLLLVRLSDTKRVAIAFLADNEYRRTFAVILHEIQTVHTATLFDFGGVRHKYPVTLMLLPAPSWRMLSSFCV